MCVLSGISAVRMKNLKTNSSEYNSHLFCTNSPFGNTVDSIVDLQRLQALCEFPGYNILCELITTLELGLNIFNFTEAEHNSI